MGLDDGPAHAQTDAHIAAGRIRRGFAVQKSRKQEIHSLRRDPAAIILHRKDSLSAFQLHPEPEVLHSVGMEHRIFQQIHQHLLDQHRIHGDADKFLRNGYLYILIWIMLMKLYKQGIDQLLQHRAVLGKADRIRIHAGDRQQIFHHAVQPLGIGLNILQ